MGRLLVQEQRLPEIQRPPREETQGAMGYIAIALAGGIAGSPEGLGEVPGQLAATESMLPPEVATALATTTYVADVNKVKHAEITVANRG